MTPKTPQDKQQIIDFINNNPLGVLATSNSVGFPHAAAIYFVLDEDLNIYFVTKENTLKHKNLKQNPLAAIAIYEKETLTTLQASGNVKVVDEIDKFMHLFNKLSDINHEQTNSDRLPVSKLFAGDYYMYCLKPKTMRLAEFKKPEQGDFQIFKNV